MDDSSDRPCDCVSYRDSCTREFRVLQHASSRNKYAVIMAKIAKGLQHIFQRSPYSDVNDSIREETACEWFGSLFQRAFLNHLDDGEGLETGQIRHLVASVVISMLSSKLSPNRVSGIIAGAIYSIRLVAMVMFSKYLIEEGNQEAQ